MSYKRDQKSKKDVLVGRQNVHIHLWWAAVLPTLRNTALNSKATLKLHSTSNCVFVQHNCVKEGIHYAIHSKANAVFAVVY